MTGPIFIGGAARSGKTLMRGLLSSHSSIVVSRRTEMWTRFYERFGDLDSDENLERCLQALLRRSQVAALSPDAERVRRDFRGGPRTYARLFALIHEQYAEQCGKARWGDQTGGLETVSDAIMQAHPDARFLHLVRDPRDRYVALMAKRRGRWLTLERSTLHWIRSATLARRNAMRYPDSYRVVSYEALVRRSDETMREVCEFVGEQYEPAMLSMQSEPRYEEERLASRTGSPLTDAYVGCHRDVLARWERGFVGVVARSEMRAFGYSEDQSSMRPECCQ
jgi:Sulfotransferase family